MDKLKNKIEVMIEELKKETSDRNMNDLEYGRYTTLIDVLEMIEEARYEKTNQ